MERQAQHGVQKHRPSEPVTLGPDGRSSSHASPPPEINDRWRILVVEDDPSIAMLVRRIVERRGAAATDVATLASARDALADGQWSAMVTDIFLPDGNGLDLIEEARAEHPRLPIAAMSASAGDLRPEAERRGADCFLHKPFSPDELWKELQRIGGVPGPP